MKKLNIAFREVKHGDYKGSIDAVLLDFVNGRLLRVECYSHVDEHSEGDISYFYRSTKPVDMARPEYHALLSELKGIYHDYEFIIHDKLPPYSTMIKKCKEQA